MIKNGIKSLLTIIVTGFGMWVIAGLWHNLVLPAVNSKVEAHHDGLFLMLLSYFILAGFMTYFYTRVPKGNRIPTGVKIGIFIGILWVLPHGLTMAGAHNTSILYEIKNALWHCIEQGAGGVIIALMKREESFL